MREENKIKSGRGRYRAHDKKRDREKDIKRGRDEEGQIERVTMSER